MSSLLHPDAPDDGGPAFPVRYDGYQPDPGMSIRDSFAMAALTGWIGTYTSQSASEIADNYGPSIAFACYAMADAMLAERVKPKKETTP